ncbi:MAG TPA: CHAT domain-containing protein [Aggregatilineales bacterium]|nr:CHAT domain-containing protein [Anaerolineales bacterium]HRE47631.1 CHAT domain-containing protein [Aggregatilineales bacterium]
MTDSPLLTITLGTDDTARIAFQGESTLVTLNFSAREKRLRELGDKVSGRQNGGVPTITPAEIKELGVTLFTMIFSGEAGDLFSRAVQFSRANSRHTRLEIDQRGAHSKVAALPWEFLCTPDDPPQWLATDGAFALYRRVKSGAGAVPAVRLTEHERLRVGVAFVQPSEMSAVEGQDTIRLIDEMTIDSRYNLDYRQAVPPVTVDSLQTFLEDRKPHIFHFIGHGKLIALDGISQDNFVFLQNLAGYADKVNTERLVARFTHIPPLAVFQACETGMLTAERASGIPPALIKQGVRTIVAMGYEIMNHHATTFFRAFYKALILERLPAPEATQRGRLALTTQGFTDRGFATPVVFVGEGDGALFDPHTVSDKIAYQTNTHSPANSTRKLSEPISMNDPITLKKLLREKLEKVLLDSRSMLTPMAANALLVQSGIDPMMVVFPAGMSPRDYTSALTDQLVSASMWDEIIAMVDVLRGRLGANYKPRLDEIEAMAKALKEAGE